MANRSKYTPEQLAAEREANRLRMAAKRLCPEYRAVINARRAKRDAERKVADPKIRKRLTANSKRHYEKRKHDPDFWKVRKAYWRQWIAARDENEQFEAFMARMMQEAQEVTECQ